MTTTNLSFNAQTPAFTSQGMNTQRFARAIPKAEDFAPMPRSDHSLNHKRGSRKSPKRRTIR